MMSGIITGKAYDGQKESFNKWCAWAIKNLPSHFDFEAAKIAIQAQNEQAVFMLQKVKEK